MGKDKKGKDVMVSKKVVGKKTNNIIFLLNNYPIRLKISKMHLRKMPLSRN
jgi:hypothetical protein